jgi:DNA-binding MarR family transcriptional regulator
MGIITIPANRPQQAQADAGPGKAEKPFTRIEDEIQQTHWRNQLSKTGINLVYTGIWLKAAHSGFFKKFGLSHPQHNLLRILRGQQGNPITVHAIKERMVDKSSNVSRITQKLQKKKLITCQPSATDKRAVDVVITPKGLDVLAKIDGRVGEINDLLAHLEPRELRVLNRLLDKIRNPGKATGR